MAIVLENTNLLKYVVGTYIGRWASTYSYVVLYHIVALSVVVGT